MFDLLRKLKKEKSFLDSFHSEHETDFLSRSRAFWSNNDIVPFLRNKMCVHFVVVKLLLLSAMQTFRYEIWKKKKFYGFTLAQREMEKGGHVRDCADFVLLVDCFLFATLYRSQRDKLLIFVWLTGTEQCDRRPFIFLLSSPQLLFKLRSKP